MVIFFIVCALLVLLKVGRIDTSLSFLGMFMFLELIRTKLYFGDNWDVYLQKFSSGTILLFAFFMITDPRTTPNASGARILWAVGIGVLSFVLTSWFYLHTAPMWALFFAAPAMVVLDKIFKANVFQWTSIKPLQS